MRNVIPSLTKDKICFLLENGNFTTRERELFDLRNKESSLEDCAEQMHLSVRTVQRVNKQLNRKINYLL